jgi:hypothetical protein
VSNARAVAVAGQRQPEIVLATHAELEQLGLDPVGALEPPGGAHDPRDQEGLQHALRRQLAHKRRLERLVVLLLLGADQIVVGAQAVLQRVLRRAGFAFRGFRAT